MREDFGKHFGVFGGYRKTMQVGAFPVHTAELKYPFGPIKVKN